MPRPHRPVSTSAAEVSADDLRARRRVAAVQTGVALVAFVVLAVVLVPWGAGGTPPPVQAEELFSAGQLDAAESYARQARAWSWSSLAVSLVFAALVGFTQWGRQLVGRLPGPWWVRVVLAVAAYVTTRTVLTFGFRVGAWQLRREVGLSTQGWGGFLRDAAVNWLLELAVLTVLLLVLIGLARRFVRTWTVIAGALAALLVLGASYVYPAVVEPLFNDFASLPEGDLRDRVTQLAAEEGVQIDDVVVADASRRTTTLNAWVSGFGDTRRVVLYDTLVVEAAPDEVMSVVAHELAHARHDDVLVGTLLGAVGAFAAVGVLGLFMGLVMGRAGERSPGDPRVAPLVLACVAFGTQLVSPLENGISRALETRADVEALCLTDDPGAFESVQRKLATRSLSDPTPPSWSQWWWGSHPTTLDRVALARAWKGEGARACDAQASSGHHR